MTHDAVQRWLDAYVDAWRTYDPAAIGALFAEDAIYAYHPYDKGEEIVRGREAIVAERADEQLTAVGLDASAMTRPTWAPDGKSLFFLSSRA